MSAEPARRRADFRFINRGTIFTLDPAAMSWLQDIRLALSVWEGLCTYDPKTAAPIPGSAFAPEISLDNRTYTFRIRPEARWSNGDPLRADDFAYAWRRAIEPGTAADYSFFFNVIEGVKEYSSWRNDETSAIGKIEDKEAKREARDSHLAEADRRFREDVGIRTLDEKTLQVRLVRPVPYFLDLCAFSTLLPLHAPTVEPFKRDDDDGLVYYDEQWVKPDNAVFNGPFVIREWKFKRHVRLEKNPHYWGRDDVDLENVEIVDVDDPNTAWLMYSAGEVDWLSSLDMQYVPKLIAASGSELPNAVNVSGKNRNDIHAFPAFGTYFYNFNCTETLPPKDDARPNPFADPRVRQAFCMAVDKQLLVDQVVRKSNPTADIFVPRGSIPGYPKVTGIGYDPERARGLLAEAGFPGGEGFPEVVILFNTGFAHGDIAQAVLGTWKQNLGVSGRVHGKEGKTFREDKKKVNFVICRASWYGDYGDPTTFLEMFETGNGNNDSGFSDANYDRLLEQARHIEDPQRRLEKLAEAETYLVNEGLPLLPLYHYVNVFAFPPDRVKGIHLTPRNMVMLRAVEVVR
jgi:oligopeptide transport system substrate-binding protein